jgi:hypothetical protein
MQHSKHTEQPPTVPFACQAARGSWSSSVLVFLLIAYGHLAPPAPVKLMAWCFIVLGLGFGVVALFGIRKYGTKDILAPALVGIFINALLIFFFVLNNSVTLREQAAL